MDTTNLSDAMKFVSTLTKLSSPPSLLDQVSPEDPIPYVIIGKDQQVADLSGLVYHGNRPNPTHTQEQVCFVEIGSFVRYVNLYKLPHTAIFFNANGLFTCNIDFHEPAGAAAWKHHRASLTLTKSLEYNDWAGKNRKPMTQADFAEFLDDNSGDLVDAAGMMEVARTLSATKNATFKSATDLHSGSSELTFSEEVRGQLGTSKALIPDTFQLEIPVFNGEPPQRIKARFRYRVEDGKLQLWYVLHRPSMLIQDRILSAAKQIQEATGLIPYQIG